MDNQDKQNNQEIINLDQSVAELQFLQELAKRRTLNGFLKSLHQLLKPYGVGDFSLMLTRPDGFQRIWMYPEKNREKYAEGRLHEVDFNVRHCLRSDDLMLQSWINKFVDDAPGEDDLFAVNKDIRRMLEQLGFQNYGAFGFTPSSGCGRAIFSFSAKGASSEWIETRALNYKATLRKIAKTVEYIGSMHHDMRVDRKLRQSELIPNKPLELLKLIASDLTLSDAAEKMCITVGTAEQHMYAAKKALGAHTQAGAVVKAIKQGLIPIK